jgi:hypothetical protein
MKIARLLIIVIGILLPYLMRIPGMIGRGTGWFTSYLGDSFGAIIFFGVFNAFCWGSIFISTFTYRHVRSVWFPVCFGFALPAVAHTFLDLSSSSMSAIALVFIPLYSLPLVFIGWLIGFWYDRKLSREIDHVS